MITHLTRKIKPNQRIFTPSTNTGAEVRQFAYIAIDSYTAIV